ncbi:MAG: dihydrodipicolinate synthase family protein [Burkholderiales bacterium]
MSFSGIYPILYAFFDANGSLDEAAMRRQIEVCADRPGQGVAALGLATEVGKLSPAEKRRIIDWTVSGVEGAKPVAITISGDTVAEQIELAAYAAERGATWLILQPPRDRTQPETYYFDFFSAVMAQARLPCAIQNAPEYLGVGLSPQGIARLARERANFVLLKGEGPAVLIREVIAANPGLSVFNGRGGLELTDNLAAGCAGMIIGVDSFDWQARIFAAARGGRTEEAEDLYRAILPGIVFMMASLEHLTCYGKRIAACRLGLAVHDRAPALAPTAFGLKRVATLADRLGLLC